MGTEDTDGLAEITTAYTMARKDLGDSIQSYLERAAAEDLPPSAVMFAVAGLIGGLCGILSVGVVPADRLALTNKLVSDAFRQGMEAEQSEHLAEEAGHDE